MTELEGGAEEELLDLGGESAGEQETDSASQFFVSKKAAAVLKHEILKQYVVPFVSKVGRWAPNGRVVYLDGYAGPGRYEDGTPGSPELILESASRVAEFRQLDCYFVERGRVNFRSLEALVSEANGRGISAHALKGRVEKHLDYVLDQARDSPLLAFIDPFGLGLSFDALTGKIFGSRKPAGATGRDATEVLLNFNANAVRRIGGLLRSPRDTPAKPATLAAMDSACGGEWWREEYLRSKDNREAVERIVGGFAQRVGDVVSAHSWTLPVYNRAHQQPAYHLVLFSRHEDGLWLFGEASSLAQEVWRRECLPPPNENLLFDDVELFEEEERQRQQDWVIALAANIEKILNERGSFVIGSRHSEVMGALLGEARKKHIRAAVKKLYKEGKTSCDGKGEVPEMFVTLPRASR